MTCCEAKELARYLDRTVVWLEQVRLGALPWRYDGKLGPEDQAKEAAIKKNERSPPVREAMLKELRARARGEAKRIWINRRALMFDWCDQVLLYKRHRVRIAALHPSDRAQAVRELMAARLDPDPSKLAALETACVTAIRRAEAKDRQIAGLLSRLAAAGLAPRPAQLSRPFAHLHFSKYAAQPVACINEYAERTKQFWAELYAACPELVDFDPQLVRRVVLNSGVLADMAKEEVWHTRRAVPTDPLYVAEAA